ncbi:putative sugar dehydrogenase [Escherichia coli]|uniref:Putative sugar dehydrogenase n=1 Tax=Escherichia coli TaxID=562 RepID=A0A376RI68_ECOLX|nr:putative sugar dehydrogenase [Escherichia coli]
MYADILATEHFSDWGYYEVNLIGGEQQIADLQQQDNLYTVAEMSADAWTARVVGVVKKALHVQMDGLETVLAAMCETANRDCLSDNHRKGYSTLRRPDS